MRWSKREIEDQRRFEQDAVCIRRALVDQEKQMHGEEAPVLTFVERLSRVIKRDERKARESK